MQELQQLKSLATQRAPGTLPFIEVYLILLENLERTLDRDTFEDPAAITDLSADFLEYFTTPLKALLEGDQYGTAWSRFFRLCQTAPTHSMTTVLMGMYIHILVDLPRALSHAGRLSPADYYRFNTVIQASVGPSIVCLAGRYRSTSARILNLMPLSGAMLAGQIITLMRSIAWSRRVSSFSRPARASWSPVQQSGEYTSDPFVRSL